MAWGRIDIPGMPFNQMMTFPVSLELRTTSDGIRLCPMPIREIKKLYANEKVFENKKVEPGNNLLNGFEGDLFDIEADIELAEADRVGFRIRGLEVTYDVKTKTLTSGWAAYDVKTKTLTSGWAAYDAKAKGHWISGESSARLEATDGRIQLRILG